MHRTDLVDLASLDDHHAADLCCERLSAHGLEVEIYDEKDLQSWVFFTKPRAHLKIQVREEDYAAAVDLLIRLEQQNPQLAASLYSCPECGSFAVEYPQFSRKFITPLLLEWLSNLGLFKKSCYCRKCHATWQPRRCPGINPLHLERPSDVFVPPPG